MRVKLKDVCEKATSNLKQSDILSIGGTYPVYGASGYLGNIDSYHQDKPYIAVVKDGAGIGRTTILPPKSSVIGTMQYLIPKENVMPEYLYYVVKHMRLQKYYTGTTIPHIYFKDYQNEEFNLADSIRQREIVKVLKNVEDTIRYQEIEINKFDELIKARFIEMFGDPVADTKNWGQTLLKEHLESIKYGTSTPPIFTDDGYAFIRATNIKNGKIVTNDMKYIPQEEADRLEKCKLSGGEIIIVRSGVNAGDTCIVTDEYIGQYAGYDMILVLSSDLHPVFFNTLINTEYMDKVVKPLTRRAAQPHLNSEQTQRLPIIEVPFELQEQFADFVKQVDKSREAVKKSLEKTQQLYDSLMQEYFG